METQIYSPVFLDLVCSFLGDIPVSLKSRSREYRLQAHICANSVSDSALELSIHIKYYEIHDKGKYILLYIW